MKASTRIKFEAYQARIGQLNGVSDVSKKFTATPSVQQSLETNMQESSEFLKKINIVGVSEQEGEKLGLGVSSPVASTTNTTTTDRATSDPSALDTDGYRCEQTNSDTHLTYQKLDMWAKFPNFQTLIRDAILKRQALDRMMIGFNGTSRAATSNNGTNPLLQDVNIGWLQKYRANALARVMAEGANVGAIRVGNAAGRDYYNLDALVFDAVNSLLEPWHQDSTDLVVICGRALLSDKYFPLIDVSQAPTETLATDIIVSQKRIGNLPAVRVPSFPANSMFVTPLSNLSIYFQEGTRRRNIVENSKRDRIENYESSNDAYVVEDYGAGCVIENITGTWV
ncbi:phage major capsid protein, P2 family [Methylobacter sp. G7]|uniref:phage major capsid protein, P2 family n=1 Tax=Methylobacter sp. G7 TaxID=3230117 RepID=UPI003D8002FD